MSDEGKSTLITDWHWHQTDFIYYNYFTPNMITVQNEADKSKKFNKKQIKTKHSEHTHW